MDVHHARRVLAICAKLRNADHLRSEERLPLTYLVAPGGADPHQLDTSHILLTIVPHATWCCASSFDPGVTRFLDADPASAGPAPTRTRNVKSTAQQMAIVPG